MFLNVRKFVMTNLISVFSCVRNGKLETCPHDEVNIKN